MHLQVKFSLARLNAIQNEKLFQIVPVQHGGKGVSSDQDLITTRDHLR